MRERLLLIAACVVVVALAYAVLTQLYFAPAQAMSQQAQTLATQLQDVTARAARAKQQLTTTAATESVATMLITGEPVADAAAHFQENARAQVAQLAGAALSSQSIVTDMGGGYSKVSVLLRARFSEAALLAFLRGVEAQQPIVLVEGLTVRPLPVVGDDKPLDVTATLSEFHADATPP